MTGVCQCSHVAGGHVNYTGKCTRPSCGCLKFVERREQPLAQAKMASFPPGGAPGEWSVYAPGPHDNALATILEQEVEGTMPRAIACALSLDARRIVACVNACRDLNVDLVNELGYPQSATTRQEVGANAHSVAQLLAFLAVLTPSLTMEQINGAAKRLNRPIADTIEFARWIAAQFDARRVMDGLNEMDGGESVEEIPF